MIIVPIIKHLKCLIIGIIEVFDNWNNKHFGVTQIRSISGEKMATGGAIFMHFRCWDNLFSEFFPKRDHQRLFMPVFSAKKEGRKSIEGRGKPARRQLRLFFHSCMGLCKNNWQVQTYTPNRTQFTYQYVLKKLACTFLLSYNIYRSQKYLTFFFLFTFWI